METERVIDVELNSWLESRTLIGEAKGILMERYDLDRDAAFAVLRQLSSHTNRKVAEIAAELVETRQLPGGRRAASAALNGYRHRDGRIPSHQS